MDGARIPLAVPYLGDVEIRNATQALESTWISSSGRFIEDFERRFAQVAGTASCLGVSNGTVALHLAMLALGVGVGDEVIVPSLTYIATANCVRYVGAEPVFADVDSKTWCLDVAAVESAVTSRTVGIIAVDLYGHPADYDALAAIAERHGLWIVEDAAEAPFATYKGRSVGSFGSVATFSFYGNKILTSGEGGAVASSDLELVSRMRLIRGQGMDPERRYFFPIIGHNFRMTNLAASILCGQLDHSEEIMRRRARIYQAYRSGLEDLDEIEFQPQAEWAEVSPWLFSVTLTDEAPLSRDELALGLDAAGIETRPFFMPLHTLPPYVGASKTSMNVTERLANRGLNLPTFPGLTMDQVARVCSAIRMLVASR